MKYIISHKIDDEHYRIYHSKSGDVEDVDDIGHDKYERRFQMLRYDESDPEPLLTYASNFSQWCEEMKERDKYKIDYTYYYNDRTAVEQVFFNNAKGAKDYEKVNFTEMQWMNKCHNGGLMYCSPGEYDCHAYDGKSFYPHILGHRKEGFKFPTKRGIENKLTKLPTRLKFGYYHCKITSSHPDAPKLFAFSKHDVYCNYSIQYARDHLNEFDFKIELVREAGNNNCYLYDDECIVESHKIFNNWYFKLTEMRKEFPKNVLLKHLLSSLSGHLTSYEAKCVPRDQLTAEENEKTYFYTPHMPDDAMYAIVKNIHNRTNPSRSCYKLLDLKDPMRFGIGRLKAFLMAWGRNRISQVAMLDLKSVVRIQTDGIVFNKPQQIDDDFFVPDKKYTGRINWVNVNRMEFL